MVFEKPSPNEDGDRAARIARLIEDVTAARVHGEDVSDETLIGAHPDLMPELAEELDELAGILRARQRAADSHQSGDAEAASTYLQTLTDMLPGYEVLGEIHAGAQGVVYQAIQESTQRVVAIKVMREGPFAGSAGRERFEREVRVLGRLNHPNIVAIHDSGEAAGCVYFVMDYVPGKRLDQHVAETTLSTRDKLELFLKICDAITVAHLRGVIHRDLKPSNIRIDPDGEPHVLDFGLAKMDTSRDARAIHTTRTGDFIGTPAYAAPEQVRFDNDAVDVRTDLYNLGVILFEMLTGDFPYPISPDIRELINAILSIEPTRPSRLEPRIDHELDTIVLKTLAKDPERRYQSVEALAADLRRYLNDEPILAHPPSAPYQLRKLVQRHRLAFTFGATVLSLLTAFGIVSAILAVQLAQQRDEALEARSDEQDQRKIAEEMTLTAKQAAEDALRGRRQAEWEAYCANIVAADAAIRARDPRAAGRRLEAARWNNMTYWEWSYLERRIDRFRTGSSELRDVLVPGAPGSARRHLAFDPEGTRLAVSEGQGGLSIWDAASRRKTGDLVGGGGDVRAVAFSPDGRVVAAGASDGIVRVWDAASAALQFELPADASVACVAFAGDGQTIAAGCDDGTVVLWQRSTGERVGELRGHTGPVSAVAFMPSGDELITAGHDATIRLWSVTQRRELRTIHTHREAIRTLALHPDRLLLACDEAERRIALIRAPDGRRLAELEIHEGTVTSLCFSPDGTRLVSGSDDGTLKLWDLEMRAEVLTLYGHEGPVHAVAWSPDGARIASAAADGTVRILQGSISASELVSDYFESLVLSADVIAFLEADDQMDRHLRDAALRIARARGGDAEKEAVLPSSSASKP